MADSKVSDMTAATSVNSADVLYLVQNNADKKLSIATLLGNLPNSLMKVGGNLVLGGTPQTLAGSGAIQTTQTLSVISNTGSSALTISNGTFEGQLKVILMTSASGPSTISANLGVSNIAFSQAGHTMLLIWYNNKWWPLGGTATVSI
jgi:hypothetical protein